MPEVHPRNAAHLIAIVGAESTGKTTLAAQLAEHFDSLWVPEYLREFTESQGRTPREDEQLSIMLEQARREDIALQRAAQQGMPYVFCDAATLMTAVYSEVVFNDLTLYKQARQLHQRYARTLLLDNAIEWQADGLQRDGPQVREPVLALLNQHLTHWGVPITTIVGTGQLRLQQAIAVLD